MTAREQTTSRTPERYDWDAEQEVDFRRYWDALVARWWLLLVGLVLGAIVGYAISLGGGQVYEAQASVYLGQPYSASGNVQLQNLQTNPSTVRQIVNSKTTIAAASKAAGLKPGALSGHIAVAAVSGSLAKLGQTPLVTITVQGAKRVKIKAAANALAGQVVAKVGDFANRKISIFRAQIASDERQEALARNQVEQATAALRGVVTPTDKLVAISMVTNAQQRLVSAEQDRLSTSQLLTQAQLIELPRVVTAAGSQKVTARSRRNSVVVAAVIGLLLGLAAALAWDAVAARAARSVAS
ncbi:MAG: Wzz/FepE/Etk N-terminal domain-containing protein [Gaiellaceae bacterium]